MAKRKRPERYRVGSISLGWRKGVAVANVYDARTGKRVQRVRLGEFSKSDPRARQALDTYAEQHNKAVAHVQAHTVGLLWDMWLGERKKDGFDNYIYSKQWVALAPVFGHRRPATLTADDFRNYARDRFKLGRSAWTVHNELVRLRTCMHWAFDHRHTPERVKVWVPSKGGSRERVLTLEEARALVAAAHKSDPHIHLFILIAFATAARHTAILDLTWDRVDFIGGIIEFDDGGEQDPMSRSWRKGRATVPMNRSVRSALERAYAGRLSDHVIEHGGRRLRTIRAGFANAVARAGIPGKVTPHTIRHTVLTWLDQAVPDARRAKLAGHADEKITQQVYTHASPLVLQEAVDRLNDALYEGAIIALPTLAAAQAPEL